MAMSSSGSDAGSSGAGSFHNIPSDWGIRSLDGREAMHSSSGSYDSSGRANFLLGDEIRPEFADGEGWIGETLHAADFRGTPDVVLSRLSKCCKTCE